MTPEQETQAPTDGEVAAALGATPLPPSPEAVVVAQPGGSDEQVEEVTKDMAIPPGADTASARGADSKPVPPQHFLVKMASREHIENFEGKSYAAFGWPTAGNSIVRLDVHTRGEESQYIGMAVVRIPTRIRDETDGTRTQYPVRSERGTLMTFFGLNGEQRQYQAGHNSVLKRLAVSAEAMGEDGKDVLTALCEDAGVTVYDLDRSEVRREVSGPLAADVHRFVNYYNKYIERELTRDVTVNEPTEESS